MVAGLFACYLACLFFLNYTSFDPLLAEAPAFLHREALTFLLTRKEEFTLRQAIRDLDATRTKKAEQ